MAVFSQASDINTRVRIWVAHNLESKRGRQLNSHTSDCYNRDEIDGFPAYVFAGLYTDYNGNDWQAKHVEFLKKWGQW